MDMALEVVPVPVTDTDRAIEFYRRVGFSVDMDQRISDEVRFVQLTPPGSGCSIHIGEGTSTMPPGTVRGLILVVDSAEAAKAELDKRGIDNQRGRSSALGQTRVLQRSRWQLLDGAGVVCEKPKAPVCPVARRDG